MKAKGRDEAEPAVLTSTMVSVATVIGALVVSGTIAATVATLAFCSAAARPFGRFKDTPTKRST